jgi:hypothetical protein
MLLTGVVVSELRDGSVGRVRGGEGQGRPAGAAHRVRTGSEMGWKAHIDKDAKMK